MQKTFPFTSLGHKRARVADAIKHDLRKYVNRERKKKHPEGFDEWTFNCRVGATAETAASTSVKELSQAVDAVALTEAPSVYVEIVAVPAHRPVRSPKFAPRSS